MRQISWSIEDILWLKDWIAAGDPDETGTSKRMILDLDTIRREWHRTHMKLWREATRRGTSRRNLDRRRVYLEYREGVTHNKS